MLQCLIVGEIWDCENYCPLPCPSKYQYLEAAPLSWPRVWHGNMDIGNTAVG